MACSSNKMQPSIHVYRWHEIGSRNLSLADFYWLPNSDLKPIEHAWETVLHFLQPHPIVKEGPERA